MMGGDKIRTELPPEEAEALLPKFEFKKLLNQDHGGCRLSLLGTIDSKPALLLVKRAPLSADTTALSSLTQSLSQIKNLSNNDIYFWFMTSSPSSGPHNGSVASAAATTNASREPTDLKVDLIWPCTEKHIRKYSEQPLRMIVETPDVYEKYVKPYIQTQRGLDRLGWIYNILDGKSEQDDIIHRSTPLSATSTSWIQENPEDSGIILSPDLNWDRQSPHSLHLLAIAERRDIWSLRDLTHRQLSWLRRIRGEILSAATKKYPEVEDDQLKLYVHYQPTYYHFHVHVAHVMFEAGNTQAVGKALGLDNLIGQLEGMSAGSKGLGAVDVAYHIGEESELWADIFQPLKEGRTTIYGQ